MFLGSVNLTACCPARAFPDQTACDLPADCLLPASAASTAIVAVAAHTAALPAPLATPLPRAATSALALPLALTHEAVSPNVPKCRFHGIGLGLGRLPVGAVSAIVTHIHVRPNPVSPPSLPLPRCRPLPWCRPLAVDLRCHRPFTLPISSSASPAPAICSARPANTRTAVAIASCRWHSRTSSSPRIPATWPKSTGRTFV